MRETPSAGRAKHNTDLAEGALFSAATFGASFAGMVALAMLVRIQASEMSLKTETTVPALAICSIERLPREESTRDRLELLDPTPLFMPGVDASAGASSVDLRDRPGGQVAELFPGAMIFKESAAGRELLAPTVPATTIEALRLLTQRRLLDGMARQDRVETVDGFKYREGKVEIYPGAASIPSHEFELGALPGVSSPNWRPVEFRLLVGTGGLPTQLVMVTSSGTAELDSALSTKLRNHLLQRVLLRPGDHRILIGP